MLQKVKLTRTFRISQNIRDKSIGMQTKGLRVPHEVFAKSPGASVRQHSALICSSIEGEDEPFINYKGSYTRQSY